MKTRDVLRAALLITLAGLLVKGLQVSLTPEFWAWVAAGAPRFVQSPGVRFLAGIAALLLVLWCAAFLRERWREIRADDERAAARLRQLRDEQVRQSLRDPLNNRNDRGSNAA